MIMRPEPAQRYAEQGLQYSSKIALALERYASPHTPVNPRRIAPPRPLKTLNSSLREDSSNPGLPNLKLFGRARVYTLKL